MGSAAPRWLARGVASTGPGGVLLVGSTPVGRAIERALKERGVTVVPWSGNDDQARAAKADGLTLYRGDLTEDVTSGVPSDLEGLDTALAVGDDEALNAMIATDLSEYFGRGQVFQLAVTGGRAADFYTRVPVLFDDSATHDELLARLEAGDDVAVVHAAGANGGTDLRARLGADGIPMFVSTPGKDLRVLTAGDRPPLKPGQELIGMIKPS